MTTILSFKSGLDIPQWRPNSPPLAQDGPGQSLAWDHRNDGSRIPLIFALRSTAAFDVYNPIVDEWLPLASPSLTAVSGGGTAVFHPSQGPRGTVAAGWTTTSGALTTALPAAVGTNQLANRGDGVGFTIRIIGKSAAGAGKINERKIIANTAGTTPTITLDVALDWTPASTDGYELLSGRVFLLGSGAIGSNTFKYYDIATNGFTALAFTNLTATISTDSSAIALSELHVSNDRQPSTGFVSGGSTYDPSGTGLNGVLATAKNCIVATAAGSTSITGSGMPSDLQTNEYRNFQVRIVEDVANPTGVGQRARISSHTSGAAGVFTVASWPVITPSATAKFVIENDDDKILLRTSATTNLYTYKIASDAWDASTTWAAGGSANSSGTVLEQCFGIIRDTSHNRLHSHIFCIEGGASTAVDMLDIAAASTGTWSAGLAYGGKSQSFTSGTTGAYDPVTLGGKYLHLCISGTQRMARFNLLTQTLELGTYLRYPQTSPGSGQKLAFNYLIDGSVKLAILHQKVQGAAFLFSQAIQF